MSAQGFVEIVIERTACSMTGLILRARDMLWRPSPNVVPNSLDTLPHFIGHGVAPNASKQVVEFGIFSRKFLDAINEIHASFGKQIFKWTSGENSNYFIGEITFVSFESELPKPLSIA